MKVIYAGRGEGKTSYILDQCKKLEGRKAVIVPRTVEGRCLSTKLRNSGDENLKAVDVYSTYEIFVEDKARGKTYSYIFVDEMQTVLQYALNIKLMTQFYTGAEHIFATLAKECIVELDEVRPKKSCETCAHQQVCKYALAFNPRCCNYYQEKK